MKKENLKELNKLLSKIIDDEGLREEFENLKKEIIPDPEFEIHVKSNDDGESCLMKIEGNKPSLMTALANLSHCLVKKSNLTKEDILEAVTTGLEED